MTDYLIYIPLLIIGFALGIFYGKEKIMDVVRDLGIGRTEDKAYYDFFTKTLAESRRLQSRFLTILIASIVGLILVLNYDPYRGAIVFAEDMPVAATPKTCTYICNMFGENFVIEVRETDKKARFGGTEYRELKYSEFVPYTESEYTISFVVPNGNITLDRKSQAGKIGISDKAVFDFVCRARFEGTLPD